MQIKEPPLPGVGNPPPPYTPFDYFWMNGGYAIGPIFVLVLCYIVLMRATRGSKHRRVIVPLVMVPLTLYMMWGLLRWRM